MVAGSILPVTIHKNQLYFLFGKENPMEDSAKGWSDFGGGVEHGETPYTTAIREGAEELSGFLGSPTDIETRLKNGFYKVMCNDYHIHLFFLPYDEKLPFYYNKNHHFLWEKIDKNVLNDSKCFEKIEIDWFSIEDIKRRKKEFRSFYREIVDSVLENLPQIRQFIKLQSVKKKTKKRIHQKRKTVKK